MWKSVVGYEGLYEVSDEGEVRTLEREVVYSNDACHTVRARRLNPCFDKDGYPVVALCGKGKEVQRSVHRLVLEAFIGPKPEGAVTRHLDHSRNNNRLENLCYGTPKENSADMIANPTYVHPRTGAKLSPEVRAKISESQKRAWRKRKENSNEL